MIKVSINNICAKLTECESLTSGMIGNLVEVSFSAEWSGLNKIAVFSNGDVTKDLLESQWNGNYIPIPQEVLATPHRTISMGVYGYEIVDGEKVLAIPTIVAEIGKTKFGADPSDDPAADPTLPVWAQIQTEVDDLDDRVTYLEEHGGGGGIPEAPIDGKQYARQDGAWAEVQGGGGGVSAVYHAGVTAPSNTNILWIDTSINVRMLESITAVYTQSGTIYPTATLNSLKPDLVVTATYNDGSTEVVAPNKYVLSGTLAVGTSAITVTFGGKTTTFNVTVTAVPVVSSISAVYTQGATVIYPSTSLDSLKDNLVVKEIYTDASEVVLDDDDYTLSGTLAIGTSTITVTHGEFTTTFTVNVIAEPTLDYITAVYTQSGVVYETAPLNNLKSDLVVTATYTDSTTYTVPSADYTLSGTLEAGTSAVTVTYNGKTTTFNVTVTAVVVESITAVYTQSGTVYTNTPLDDLKEDLIVTAEYTDGTEQTVESADYTLSGTLAVGTSTITVSYSGKTTTFTVDAQEVIILPEGYQLCNYLASTQAGGGTQTYIKTGYSQMNNIRSEIKLRPIDTEDNCFAGCYSPSEDSGIQLRIHSSGKYRLLIGSKSADTIPADTNIHTFVMDGKNHKAYADGVEYQGTTGQLGTPNNYEFYLFASNQITDTFGAKVEIYYAKMWDNDVLVRNYVPCLDGDGTPCMYDLVNEQTYYNDSTGTSDYQLA